MPYYLQNDGETILDDAGRMVGRKSELESQGFGIASPGSAPVAPPSSPNIVIPEPSRQGLFSRAGNAIMDAVTSATPELQPYQTTPVKPSDSRLTQMDRTLHGQDGGFGTQDVYTRAMNRVTGDVMAHDEYFQKVDPLSPSRVVNALAGSVRRAAPGLFPLADVVKETPTYDSMLRSKGLGGAVVRGLAGGSTGLGEFAGGALEMLGTAGQNALAYGNMVPPIVADAGRKLGEYYQGQRESVARATPEELRGNIADKPELLADPRWMTESLINAGISMAPALAGGVGAGTTVGGLVGGLQEAAGSFQGMREKGVDGNEALGRSVVYGAVSAALNKLGLDKILAPKAYRTLLQRGMGALTAGGTEAFTEWLEEPAQAFVENVGEMPAPELLQEIKQSAFEGLNVVPSSFLLGGGGNVIAQASRRGGQGTKGPSLATELAGRMSVPTSAESPVIQNQAAVTAAMNGIEAEHRADPYTVENVNARFDQRMQQAAEAGKPDFALDQEAPFPGSVAEMDQVAEPADVAPPAETAEPAMPASPAVDIPGRSELEATPWSALIRLGVEAGIEKPGAMSKAELVNTLADMSPRRIVDDAEQLAQQTALPQGQGFNLVGTPQDVTQAEAASMEPDVIASQQPVEPRPTARELADLDAGRNLTEEQLVRQYQEERQRSARQEYGTKALSPLWDFLRGRVDAKSISDTFGSSVLESLRGKAPRDLFRSREKGGMAWDKLEQEAKSQGLLNRDADLLDTLMANVTNKEQAQRDRVNGVNGVWQREEIPAGSNMPAPEETGMVPLNSDGTVRDGAGPMYRKEDKVSDDDISTAGAKNDEIETARRMWAEMGTDSPYFKKWSEDAPVVGLNESHGFKTNQKVVVKALHGSSVSGFVESSDIKSFDKSKAGDKFGSPSEGAFFFSNLPGVADDYANYGKGGTPADQGAVYPVYLSFKNPLVVDGKWFERLGMTDHISDEGVIASWDNYHGLIRERAKRSGHDGVIMLDGPERMYVAFSSQQIKSSIGNRGMFDQNNADIRYRQNQPNAQGLASPDVKTALVSTPYAGVEVLDSPADLADAGLLDELRRTGNLGSKGAYDPRTGKAYVFAGNHADVADAIQTARDELFHRGTFRWAEQQAQANPKAGPAFKQLNSFMAQVRYAKRDAINAWLNENNYDELKNTNYGAAEWLTHEASRQAPKWHDRYVAALVGFFRKIGNALGFDFKMTESEIRNWSRKVEGMIGEETRTQASQTDRPDAVLLRKPSFSDPAAEAAYREGQKGVGDQRGLTAKVKEKLTELGQGMIRHFVYMPRTKEYAKAHELLRQLEQAPNAAQKTSIDWLKKMTGDLTREEFDVFNRKVFLDDMGHDIEQGRTLPDGFTAENHAASQKAIDAQIKNMPAVQKAIETRKVIHESLGEQLVEHGILDAAQLNNPAYFRHEVLKYAREWQNTQGSGKRLNKPKPGYAKGREGSSEMYSTNFLEVEFAYMHRALVDIKTEETLAKVKEAYDKKPQATADAKKWNNDALIARGRRPGYMKEAEKREILGKTYRTWRDYIPEGYTTFQPSKGLLYVTGNSITDAAVMDLMDAAHGAGSADKAVLEALDGVREALQVAGKKPELVLPEPLAKQLEELKPKREVSFYSEAIQTALGSWKQWQLFNPRRWVKYNLNNTTGDLDGVLAAIKAKEYGKFFSHFTPAVKELYAVAKGKADPSDMYNKARWAGVIDSGLTVGEIPDIQRLGEFERLLAKETGKGAWLKPLRWYWRAAQGSSEFRESMLRYTAFRYFLTELDKGRSVSELGYGASYKDLVDGLETNEDKAALLARDLLVDYGAISAYGTTLRNRVFPFYSWMEGNIRRYSRIMGNAIKEGPVEGFKAGGIVGAGIGARVAAYAAIRASILYGLITMWNHMMFPDEEQELDTIDRLQLHAIIGRDDEGNVQTLRLQGALSDFLSWAGFPDVVGVLSQVQDGKASYGDAIKTVAKAGPNKLINSLTPFIKTPIEWMSGYSLYPDATAPRKMTDKPREVARTFSLENEYDAAMNQIDGRPMKDPYIKTWLKSVVYERNVGEINYSAVRDRIEKWKQSKGIESAGWSTNPKAELSKQYRLATKWGDVEAAGKIKERMVEELGISPRDVDKTIKQSLLRAAPLAGVPRKEREDFLATLDERDKERLQKATEWYKKTYLDGEGLADDYYLREVSADAKQDKAKFKEMIQSGDKDSAKRFAQDNDLAFRSNVSAKVDAKLRSISAKRNKIEASKLAPETKERLVRDLDVMEEKVKSEAMKLMQGRGIQPKM